MIRLTLLFLAILNLSNLPCRGLAAEPSRSEIEEVGSALKLLVNAGARLTRMPLDEPAGESFLALDYALTKSDPETAVLGIAALGRKHCWDLLELVWWRQGNPVARDAVLLLFYVLRNENIDGFPAFKENAARFSTPEASQRDGEIQQARSSAIKNRDPIKAAFIEPGKK